MLFAEFKTFLSMTCAQASSAKYSGYACANLSCLCSLLALHLMLLALINDLIWTDQSMSIWRFVNGPPLFGFLQHQSTESSCTTQHPSSDVLSLASTLCPSVAWHGGIVQPWASFSFIATTPLIFRCAFVQLNFCYSSCISPGFNVICLQHAILLLLCCYHNTKFVFFCPPLTCPFLSLKQYLDMLNATREWTSKAKHHSCPCNFIHPQY